MNRVESLTFSRLTTRSFIVNHSNYSITFLLLLFIVNTAFSSITWTNMIPQSEVPVMTLTLSTADSLIGIDETQTVYLKDTVSNSWHVMSSTDVTTPYLDKNVTLHRSGTVTYRSLDRFYLSHDFGKEWNISTKIISDFHKLSPTDYIGFDDKQLLHSTDGSTWSEVATLQNGISQVTPVNDSFVLALIDRDSLYASSDSGKTWSLYKHLPNSVDSILSINDSTCFLNFFFGDGFATSNDTLTSFVNGNSNNSEFVYHDSLVSISINSSEMIRQAKGSTIWEPVSLSLLNNINTIYRWKDTLFADGENNEQLYSTDNGLTWTDPIYNFNEIVGVDFVDSLTGFILSGDNIYKTTDCGVTWILHSTIDPGRVKMHAFDMYDENNGYIVGNSSMAFHMSNGSTWQEKKLVSNYLELNDVLLCSSDEWYVIGERGTILTSSNMGVKWNYLRDVSMQSPSGIAVDTFYHSTWITGYDGVLYKGDANGENWEEKTSDDNFNFSGVSFYNSQSGIAIGSNNVFTTGKTRYAQTSDGGETWVEKEIIGTTMGYKTFHDVLFVDNANIYLFGNASFESHDGGVTWAESEGFGAIEKVCNYGKSGLWAFGNNTLMKADTLLHVAIQPTMMNSKIATPALLTNVSGALRLTNIPSGIENVTFEIFSYNGQNVASYQLQQLSGYSASHSLAKGMYIGRVMYSGKQFSFQFNIQ